MPAIVLLLAAGIIAGPVTGLIMPAEIFGELLRPMIGLAVAIILFEGGLTLDFAQIKKTSDLVRRLVVVGAPLTWLLTYFAAHHVAGLDGPARLRRLCRPDSDNHNRRTAVHRLD